MKKIRENVINFILVALIVLLVVACRKQIIWAFYYANQVKEFKFVFPFVNNDITNDTFFTIAMGKNIIANGIQKEEILTWHQGLNFSNPRWLFDVFIAFLYSKVGLERNIYIYNNYVCYNTNIAIFCLL
jgi:hypothetical protein